MTSLLVAAAEADVWSDVVAAVSTEQNNFGDTRSGALAGPLGLVFILLLGIATVLLIRNMNSRIRRLPESFDREGTDGANETAGGDRTDSAGDGTVDRSVERSERPEPAGSDDRGPAGGSASGSAGGAI